MKPLKKNAIEEQIECLHNGLKFCLPINKILYNRLKENIERKQKVCFRFRKND